MREAQLDAVVLGDSPQGFSELGFTLSGHELGSTFRLGCTDIILTDSGGGFEGWSLRGVQESVANVPAAALGDAGGKPRSSTIADTHPNGIRGIDHIVFHSGDPESTAASLENAGIERRGGRSTDSYGAPMRQMFFWLGDVILELIGPGADEPTSSGPISFSGLALVSDDLDSSVAHLGELAGNPKDAVQHGRRICGLRGEKVGITTPLALMSPHV